MTRRRCTSVTSQAILLTGLLFVPPASYAQTRYRVVDLGDVPGGIGAGDGWSLSENGNVAGDAFASDTTRTATFTEFGRPMQNIGGPSGSRESMGLGVNNHGEVVGTFVETRPSGVPYFGAFYWNQTSGFTPVTGPPGSIEVDLEEINNQGIAVGASLLSGHKTAFTWTTDGDLHILPASSLGSSTIARSINDLGNAAGQEFIGGRSHAVYWDQLGIHDVGVFVNPSIQSASYAISNTGSLTGYILRVSGSVQDAFYWSPTSGMLNLGDLPGGGQVAVGLGINDHEQVVGIGAVNGPVPHGWIWKRSTGMQDLNLLLAPGSSTTWLVESAKDINNAGVILATAKNLTTGNLSQVLLNPIPEPSCLLGLGAAGLVAIFAWRGSPTPPLSRPQVS